MADSNKIQVKSLAKALNILKLFDYNNTRLSHVEIAQKMQLPTATASRLLSTLQECGFLNRDMENGKYYLGREIYYLGQMARENISLSRESSEVLEQLKEKTGETAHVFVRDGINRVCVGQVESDHSIKMTAIIGRKDLIWVGSTGRVLLAYCNDKEREDLFLQIKEMWPTIDLDQLRRRVERVRREGVARKEDEWNRNCACIAAPIFGLGGRMEGALAVSVPDFRFPEDDSEYVRLVKEGAQEISNRMGYAGERGTLV